MDMGQAGQEFPTIGDPVEFFSWNPEVLTSQTRIEHNINRLFFTVNLNGRLISENISQTILCLFYKRKINVYVALKDGSQDILVIFKVSTPDQRAEQQEDVEGKSVGRRSKLAFGA